MSKDQPKPWVYANPEKAKADQERARSNAAGEHAHKTTKRLRTRETVKKFHIKEEQDG